MSYREDLKEFGQARKKRKKLAFLIIKITVVLLAVALLAATAVLIADLIKGNESYDGGATGVGKDRFAPVVKIASGTDAIYIYVGETVVWRNFITVTDDSSVQISVDNSKIDIDKVGEYKVIYTVTDAAGNTTKFEADVVVTKKEYTYSTLMSMIEKKASAIGITKTMSKKEQVIAVYEYVNNENNIAYNKTGSNIPSIDRSNWEIDWIEEAIRTLSKNSGDCYSYYSVSKAFFEYLGIENVGIQRDNSNIASNEGTHFWSVVNIGTTEDEWYYYDSTRLAGKFNDGTKNGCLMTLKKIQSYVPNSNLGYNFYTFDPSKYPTVSTKELS